MRFDEHHRLIYFVIMPRVVADQRHKFDTNDLFVRLSRINEVRYIGSLMMAGTDTERREKFLRDCRDGKVDITIAPSGFNLELHIAPGQEAAGLAPDIVDFNSEPPKVHICSHFILNGVCVRWRGWIDRNTLQGQGRVEFDVVRAQVEHQRLQQELLAIQERLQQRHQQQHSEREESRDTVGGEQASPEVTPTTTATATTTSVPTSSAPSSTAAQSQTRPARSPHESR